MNENRLVVSKDTLWLQLEVCREFQRNKCSREINECKFAHPPPNIEIKNGKVIACYDSIKGRCNRKKPPCKYFHPTQSLKDQLLTNGRNHLAFKHALKKRVTIACSQAAIHISNTATTNYALALPNHVLNFHLVLEYLMPAIFGPQVLRLLQANPSTQQMMSTLRQKVTDARTNGSEFRTFRRI